VCDLQAVASSAKMIDRAMAGSSFNQQDACASHAQNSRPAAAAAGPLPKQGQPLRADARTQARLRRVAATEAKPQASGGLQQRTHAVKSVAMFFRRVVPRKMRPAAHYTQLKGARKRNKDT
jgi:hypothetical protein